MAVARSKAIHIWSASQRCARSIVAIGRQYPLQTPFTMNSNQSTHQSLLRVFPRARDQVQRCLHVTQTTPDNKPNDESKMTYIHELFERVTLGDRGALAKAITLSESQLQGHRYYGQQVISKALALQQQRQRLNPAAKPTFRIGLSGPPGAGKSSFIETFGTMLTEHGHKLAVLSIDPSSSVTGGSILGDKTRMTMLSRNPHAYIRPSPSRGTLGGVARSTSDSIVLCEAAGYDIVLVETVGVGQSEIAVADMVDMYVLIVPPGGGDVLQGLKRGIVELVDMIIVNKADGDLLPATRRAKMEYTSALKLLKKRSQAWSPQVFSVSSHFGNGVEDVWAAMQRYHTIKCDNGSFQQTRRSQSKIWMWHHISDRLLAKFKQHHAVNQRFETIESQVLEGDVTAGQGADMLLDVFTTVDHTTKQKQV